jgi:pyrimidine-nucleoside phosphorylase
VDGAFRDYQMAAMLMAIAIRGMTDRETRDLTMAMAHSGEMLDLSHIAGPRWTSTPRRRRGYDDTDSRAAGRRVRREGGQDERARAGAHRRHAGQVESIPGMRIDLSVEQFETQVNRIGCAVIGQTKSLAPADKLFYALRDVTGTVDSMPLIVSSILSKKIAAGCDAVVLDVKTGTGAIMPTLSGSIELAKKMVEIAT